MKLLRIYLIVLFSTLVSILQAYGYEGYEKFPMKGNSIFPLTDVNIKLSEINVLMENKKRKDVAIKVISEYFFENLSNEGITFKVALPVVSDCLGCTKMPDGFSISVNNNPIQTSTGKIIAKDFLFRIYKERSFREGEKIYPPKEISERVDEIPLIIWELSFKPNEKKKIVATYIMEWYIDPGAESLEYDLSTLYLWKGNIEKASFRLILPQELIDVTDIKTGNAFKWRWPKPKITIQPENYEVNKTNNSIEWFFRNLNKKRIGYITVDLDYRAPGIVGE
ncbi:MAG: hypothetical protein AB1306_07215 [Nitrospirota bacterium]